ncbi:MAG: ABC transporter ATP-binding protein [Pseudomonadota bacterium]
MLEVRDLAAGYGDVQVLRGVALHVGAGEILCLLGRNGAGKTTTLKTILGLVDRSSGQVRLDGEDLTGLPAHEVPKRGIGYVPQGRRLFAELTVADNLEVGLMTRRRGADVRDRMIDLFPVLGERLRQRAGTLSGGEQQMLAMARALCLEPRVLLLDEPTEGLQPSMIARIREVVTRLRETGVATILVEQRIDAIRTMADRVTYIENGETRETLDAAIFAERDDLLQRYIGVGA